jgi:leucyl aminopeptidase (aminopeptidase T)
MANEEFTVNPQQVLAEAVQEPRRHGLADYQEAIRVLKEEKEFSFREIAVWLQQRGLKVDHNAVWRAHSNTAPEVAGHRAHQRSERLERQQAHDEAMPWMEGV